MSGPLDYLALRICDTLPDRRGAGLGDAVPSKLIGAEIIGFGAASNARIEGGGLIIDYRPQGSAIVHRLVFALNDAGMWVEYDYPS
jgi:hypothetical protein